MVQKSSVDSNDWLTVSKESLPRLNTVGRIASKIVSPAQNMLSKSVMSS